MAEVKEKRAFAVLENSPIVMNTLAAELGLSPALSFFDVYSFDDPDLLALIPRPAYALLAIIPLTETWKLNRLAEDEDIKADAVSNEGEQIIWFKQTIPHACGSIGLLHCVMNGQAVGHVKPSSDLDKLRKQALPLCMTERAALLANSTVFEEAHGNAAALGESTAPSLAANERVGQHFVAFVKGEDGHLWELEGSRKGPIDRGVMRADEDVLSSRALDMGIRRIINREREKGGRDLRFSCIVLAPISKQQSGLKTA